MKTKAAVLYEMKKPRPYAQSQPLVIEEVELSGPGTGEVLVEIVRAGLCHSDLSTINGSRPRTMPMVIGHEASGVVREVGENVDEFKPEDHVIFSFVPSCGYCLPCSLGRPALCENGARANSAGTLLNGRCCFKNSRNQQIHHHLGVSAFSQYTVVAQESIVRIDKGIPLEKAAVFGCAVLTGVGAVCNTAKVEAGTSVAIFGLGGVGLSAVMGAKLAGAWPIIAIDTLDHKLQLARRLGATHTVNAQKQDPVETIKDIARGRAHYVFEAVGNEKVLAQAYSATRAGGKTVSIGLPHPKKMLSLPAVTLVAEERTLMGSYMGSSVPRRDIPRFLDLYQGGQLPADLLLSGTIGLGEINAGFDALDSGKVVRQIVSF